MKRNKVWDSIRGVSRHIEAVPPDLKILSSALTQIACEKNDTGLDGLNGYCIKIKTLTTLLNEVEPSFAPTSSRICKRIGLEIVLKSDRLERSLNILKKLKVASSMAQAVNSGKT